MIVLDTDVLVDILRGHPAAVAWLGGLGRQPLIVPGLVAMELIQGCSDRAEQVVVENTLRPFHRAWPAAAACEQAYDTFARYRLSHSIGLIDALVGHLAVSLSAPLHTFNRKHFSVVPGLSVVEPYTR